MILICDKSNINNLNQREELWMIIKSEPLPWIGTDWMDWIELNKWNKMNIRGYIQSLKENLEVSKDIIKFKEKHRDINWTLLNREFHRDEPARLHKQSIYLSVSLSRSILCNLINIKGYLKRSVLCVCVCLSLSLPLSTLITCQ